jgi:hypothetical protein
LTARNKVTYLAMVISAMIASIVTFIPWINSVIFLSYYPPAVALLGGVASGIILYIWEFGRRFLRKRGYFGGVPKRNVNLLELIRTTSTIQYASRR